MKARDTGVLGIGRASVYRVLEVSGSERGEPSLDHERGGELGPGAEPVQGFLAGVSAVGACDDRGTGLRAGGAAGWTGGSEFL